MRIIRWKPTFRKIQLQVNQNFIGTMTKSVLCNRVWNFMKWHWIYRIIRIYFGLAFLYPVHPVDPVRKWPVYAVKFLFRSDWPLAARGGQRLRAKFSVDLILNFRYGCSLSVHSRR